MPNATDTKSSKPYRMLVLLRVAALLILSAGAAGAAQRFETPTLYLRGDTLMVDLTVDSLFSGRAREAIASGMTTSIVYQFELSRGGNNRTQRALSIRLDHDIWEGRYTVLRLATPADTLVTDSFEEAERFCTTLSEFALTALPEGGPPYVLRTRALVDLISPEQEIRTRRWLNLLERGSILELFFSLEPGIDDTPWTPVARFRKSDLPVELSGPVQEETP